MAPVSKLLLGGVALATLQGCGGPNKVTNLDTKVDIPVDLSPPIAPVTDVDDENDDAGVQSNDAQIVVKDENIGEISDANTLKSSRQGVESDGNKAGRIVEDLQKKTQQIWNAVMSKKGGAIAAGVALTGTLATAIGYKVKQHRAQAGRTCTAVGEGVSDKFVGVSYYDGQKVNFECATGYTLTTDDEVTVECDANGEARITACSKNSLTILGKIFKPVAFLVLAVGLAYGALLKFTPTETHTKMDASKTTNEQKESDNETKEIALLYDKIFDEVKQLKGENGEDKQVSKVNGFILDTFKQVLVPNDTNQAKADETAINILKSTFVKKCDGDDNSSTKAGFARLISFDLTEKISGKDDFPKKLTDHIKKLVTEMKASQTTNEQKISETTKINASETTNKQKESDNETGTGNQQIIVTSTVQAPASVVSKDNQQTQPLIVNSPKESKNEGGQSESE